MSQSNIEKLDSIAMDEGEQGKENTNLAKFISSLFTRFTSDFKPFGPHAVSFVLHLVVILILFFTVFQPFKPASVQINASTENGNSLNDMNELDLDAPEESDTDSDETTNSSAVVDAVNEIISEASSDSLEIESLSIPSEINISEFGPEGELDSNLPNIPTDVKKLSKAQLARRFGGSLGSERAVQDALKWLAEHQFPDGSWRIAHNKCPNCKGKCSGNGVPVAPTGATGLAILPFLAAGHTHKTKGPYQDVIKKGLGFLTSQMKKTVYGGDFRSAITGSKRTGGSMYAHGIATLTIAEAYSITRDSRLKRFLIPAVRFIENTQGTDGGWSYFGNPKSPFTTVSLVGWQVIALYSAQKAGIKTNPKTWRGIVKYFKLNREYANGKGDGRYGYSHINVDNSPTAAQPIGLLTELYLTRGSYGRDFEVRIKELIKKGPHPKMAYYNYYAQQLVFHYTGGKGKLWKEWNQKMLNIVVSKQDKNGHQNGSWFQRGAPHYLSGGGRMMDTSLNTLILAVYFRHLPLFSGGSVEDPEIEEFNLNR